MPKRKQRRGPPMSDEVKAKLAASDKGSYYNQQEWISQLDSSDTDDEAGILDISVRSSASARKLCADKDTDSDSSADSDEESETAPCDGNLLWDCEQLEESVNSSSCCKKCRSSVRMVGRNHKGWNMEVAWLCCNDQCPSSKEDAVTWTSTSKPAGWGTPSINKALVLAMRAIGKGWTGATTLSGMLNLPAPLHPTNWARHTKQWSAKASTVMQQVCKKVGLGNIPGTESNKDISDHELQETVVDVPASLDGSWKSRSQSRHGVVAVISVPTAEVLDAHVSCSTSQACKKWEDKSHSSVEYLEWFSKHAETCKLNHQGSAQSMEAAGALMVYRRSMENKVRYNPFVGDGDSKSFKTVSKEKPYGQDYSIEKEECVGHIQKRMGTRLRKEVEKSKGNGLPIISLMTLVCKESLSEFYTVTTTHEII